MRKSIAYFCIFNLAVLLLCSCSNGSKTAFFANDKPHIVRLDYAHHLHLIRHKGYCVAEIQNPWDTTKILDTYILVPHDEKLPTSLPKGTIIHIPLRKAVIYTSVHSSLATQIGATQNIAGICDLQYISQDVIRQGVRSKRIADLGNSMSPDVEKLMSLKPDGILVSPFENSGGYGRVGQLGIPIIECADYMEPTPLGRAEWVKFYGLLFGQEKKADSLFTSVKRQYLSLKELAQKASTRPEVFCGTMEGAVWYIPGGKSTTGILYADAGARYAFASNEKSGSVPLPFEAVYSRAAHTTIWFVNYNQPGALTYKELLAQNEHYAHFYAFRLHHVFACNTGHTPYYEEYPFHPDLLLRNLIEILHPELLQTKYFRYYCSLKQ